MENQATLTDIRFAFMAVRFVPVARRTDSGQKQKLVDRVLKVF